MTLDPATYLCPDDHTDLTGLVTEALGGGQPPVAYLRRSLLARPAYAPQPFEVAVTCPGGTSGKAHSLVCTGTYKS
jgi:hypothetical protein